MYDLVTRDYSKKNDRREKFSKMLKRYARNGSINCFHDSLKAEANLRYALPRAIEWLQQQGYELLPIDQ